MPYISTELREQINPTLKPLLAVLEAIDDEDKEGVCNYVISRVLARTLKPVEGWRYKWLNRAVGVLECCKQEFYRRLAINYEEKCIEKNGDIPEYSGW